MIGTLIALIIVGAAAIASTAVFQLPPVLAGIGAAALILLFTVYHGLRYHLQTRKILDDLASELENVKVQGLHGSPVDNEVFQDAREAFNEGLVELPGQSSWFSRSPAEDSYNRRTILERQLNLAVYQSIPNLLIGVGILFTFTGIVVVLYTASHGVADLAGSNVDAAKDSLQNLFSALSVKFITSIAGIACSAVFNQVEKQRGHQLDHALQELCSQLNRQAPLLRFEDELLSGIRGLDTTRSAGALKEAADALQVTSQRLGEQIGAIAEAQGKMTPEALGAQISQVLDSRFAPVFEAIQKDLSNLAAIKHDQGQDIVQHLMKALRDEVIEPVT